MSYLPQDYCRPEITQIAPYLPGKSVAQMQRETGMPDFTKLASNENIMGVSPKVVTAIKEYASQISCYPESQEPQLIADIARHHRLAQECITLGNGSNEILELLGRCFLQQGVSAVYSQYAFAVYALTVQVCGAQAKVASANPEDESMPYGHNLAALREQIADNTRIVFIANPNNPTGSWLQKEALLTFLDELPSSVLVVVDQAYMEYTAEHGDLDLAAEIERYPNLVLTQTFSKIYGLAGLRIGYAISSPRVSELLNRIRQPFNVNAMAIKAATAALKDQAYVQQCVRNNSEGMQQLQQGLTRLGLRTLPSAGNFIMVKFKRADWVYQQLLKQGIIVRPLNNYNLPDYLRITIGLPHHHEQLLNALGGIVKKL